MVLQSRAGYQQVYKDWIKLRRGIDLYNGASNIGTLQIWEIYELWCFIKMKRMVKQLLHIEKSIQVMKIGLRACGVVTKPIFKFQDGACCNFQLPYS